MRNEARQKIQAKPFMIYSIKRIADTNILDGLTSSSKRKKGGENEDEKGKAPSDEDDPHFNYANSALANSALMIIYHPLMNSVIYDSGCSQPLTFDKTRFLKHDLISSNDQIKISDGHMQIEEYGTMLVWGQLKGKKVEMTFKKTAYIPTCFVTLVSASKLEKEGFDRDHRTKTLINTKTDEQVCEIQGRFGVHLLEYNPVSRDDQLVANSVQLSKNIMVKATPWQWHQRLGHCRPQVIDHLPKEWVISRSEDGSEAPKTVKCQTCAVSKMHRLVQKQPSARATKPYEVLHFDLIIYGIRGFDGITCIAHFTDEFTHYSWVFSLTDHREKTLMPVFKGLINRCDRSGIAINSMVRIIRTGQETSIGKRLEDWIINQGIIWDWSAKNILEQNGISERYGVLLTEKARCIREHAKLPEDLFPECYLTAEHLMNRTLNQALNWESPLVRIQKLINQNKSVRPELDHLKVYGCKAYPLLKGADVPPRGSKLKPRAFVGYLVGYNSTNIFRVWNSEKGDVSGYRDVIFDEGELYDTYNKGDPLVMLEKTHEKEPEIELQNGRMVEIPTNQLIDLDSEDDEWLETSIRDRLVLEGKRAVELPTSPPKGSSQRRSSRSPTLVSSQPLADPFTDYPPLPESPPSESQADESRVNLKRDPSSMDLADRILEMRRKREVKRNVISADLDEANILEGKRVRFASSKYSKSDYAQLAWTEEEWGKIPEFHVAFMAGLMKFDRPLIENQIDVRTGLKVEAPTSANRIHISTLPPSLAHWRAMLKHPHGDGFRKAAQLEFDAIEGRGTWEIVNRSSISENQKIIPLKWVFIYKNDSNDYLTKYKARIVVRGDLQDADPQDVYAATLASKIFRVLMALVAAFHLETRQLDAVNAFLNAHNDEPVYCQMSDGYRLDGKCYRIIRALYDQRKSPLL
jgi:hypothetical protein